MKSPSDQFLGDFGTVRVGRVDEIDTERHRSA
jgi:hypothetical protein